jgi:hypothetical protein
VTIINIITNIHFGLITPAIKVTAQSGTSKAITKAVTVPAINPRILDMGKSEIGLRFNLKNYAKNSRYKILTLFSFSINKK